MDREEFVETAGIAGFVVETQRHVVELTAEIVTFEVVPEAALALAALVRTAVAPGGGSSPTTRSAPGSSPSQSRRAATAPASNDDVPQ